MIEALVKPENLVYLDLCRKLRDASLSGDQDRAKVIFDLLDIFEQVYPDAEMEAMVMCGATQHDKEL